MCIQYLKITIKSVPLNILDYSIIIYASTIPAGKHCQHYNALSTSEIAVMISVQLSLIKVIYVIHHVSLCIPSNGKNMTSIYSFLLWLINKISSDQINSGISEELPKEDNSLLFDLVLRHKLAYFFFR